MRQLPVRARVLVSVVAASAFVILAWALVMVGLGDSAGVAEGMKSRESGRLTLIELVIVALVTVVVRSLVFTDGSEAQRRRNLVLGGGLIVVAVALITKFEFDYSHSHRVQHDPLALLAILALVTFLAASSSSFSAGDGAFTVDQVLPVLIASYLICGTSGGVVVAGIMALTPAAGSEPVKHIFNSSVKVLSVFAASAVFAALSSIVVHDGAIQERIGAVWANELSSGGFVFLYVVLAVLAANVVFVLVNTLLVSSIVSLTHDSSLLKTWVDMARNVGGPLVLNSALGLILAIVYKHSGVGVVAMVLVLLPIFSARWVFAQIAGERMAQEATLAALIKAVETKDWYTKGHSERVAVAALQIGASLKLDAELMRELRFAGMLHDVGKLGVPTGVLIKPGRLDDAEFDAIKRHPVLGQEVVRGIEFLDEAKRGIYYHHERIDGRGYPEGLKGDDIPLFARILGVADAFDSMTQVRSYRGARSIEAALEELNAHRDTQFDTRMVDAIIAALDAGWKPETPPVVADSQPQSGVPALGVDDDDPSAAAALAAHRPGPTEGS